MSCPPFVPHAPPYTDADRAQLRAFMGYSKMFTSSNTLFENTLNLIESVPAYDDGSTFNQTLYLMNRILEIDNQIEHNSHLGLGSEVEGKVKFDAARNDRMLRCIGRNYIAKLAIIFSMAPAHDYFGKRATDLSGNLVPRSYDY